MGKGGAILPPIDRVESSRYIYQMHMVAIRQRLNAALLERGTNAYRAAREAGLPQESIRQVINGHEPRASRLSEICDALGLEFYIGPPRAAETTPTTETEAKVRADLGRIGAAVSGALPGDFTPVADRRLAETISALVDEYEELNGRGRDSLTLRFWLWFPELRKRTLRRVVASLGWRFLEAEGSRSESRLESRPRR